MPTAPGLDPRAVLASAISAQPGVYALLLGSGVSTGAGIPTGWGVVDALTRRLAAAAHANVGEDFDAEQWWAENGDGQPLGYSGLLQELASTPAARRQLLAEFFEASDEDREAGLKVPGPAHRAVAELVRRGAVRVIVETNFDRLVEQALTAAGVSYQVVDSPSAVTGMEPLTHARCTVIKLHGDYARLDQLNTLEELSSYHPDMSSLLERVLDEYGLIVSGWSGDWDVALVEAIKGTRSRRYPLYWLTRSEPGEAARELIARHRATVAPNANADDVFPDLVARVEALDELAAPPLTQAMAIAQLKRWLPNPLEHIRLRDLLMGEVEKIATTISGRPQTLVDDDAATLERAHTELSAASETLVRLIATGTFLDRDEQHTDLWVEVLDRMLKDAREPSGTYNGALLVLDLYPALLVMHAVVAGAIGAHREKVAIRILTEPRYRRPFSNNREIPACTALHSARVLTGQMIHQFHVPGSGQRWKMPESHLVRSILAPSLLPLVGASQVDALMSRVELRVALAQHLVGGTSGHFSAATGEFLLDQYWDHVDDQIRLRWIIEMVERGDAAPWSRLTEDQDLEDQINDFEVALMHRRFL